MSKISLRWRITILMGILVLIVSVFLTIISIQNMNNTFAIPLTHSYVDIENGNKVSEGDDIHSFTDNAYDMPYGSYYMPEINLNVDDARQTFSIYSYFYMALVIIISMIVAYHLAGRAMNPISELNNEIETIDVKNLSKRITIPQTKDEIENLSRSFNQLLIRLEQEFEKEKRFSANVAHELKTPLATIMTSSQVLKMNDTTTIDEYRENMDITLQSAQRISGVVDGLLMLNRSYVNDQFESIDISQMLKVIIKEIELIYFEKNIMLTCDFNAEMLMGNPILIYRAFFNLIENAYKYTEKNGSITITSHSDENETTICISDTGIGIPSEDIENIFEPFYRADKSRSRKIAGAGLGLSIAKEILDLHKANISISSEKGRSTVVEVKFKH